MEQVSSAHSHGAALGVKKGYLTRPWLTEDNEQITHRQPGKRERRLVPDELDGHGKLKKAGEERRLLALAGSLQRSGAWLQRLIIAALETCCRRGELLSLQWRDVNLKRSELTIRAENAKDDESRVLPISQRLRSVLEMVKLDPNGEEHKLTAFVFGDRIGQQVKDPKKAWQKACKAAKITDLRFHDLRHEAASRLLEQGWADSPRATHARTCGPKDHEPVYQRNDARPPRLHATIRHRSLIARACTGHHDGASVCGQGL